jgi:hypothetical protein
VVAAGGGGEGAADAFVELEHISSVELLRVVAGSGGGKRAGWRVGSRADRAYRGTARELIALPALGIRS